MVPLPDTQGSILTAEGNKDFDLSQHPQVPDNAIVFEDTSLCHRARQEA